MAGEVAGFLNKLLRTRVRLSKLGCTVENEPAMKETKAGVEYQRFSTLGDETNRIMFFPFLGLLNQCGIPCVLHRNSPVSKPFLRAYYKEEETSAGFAGGL